MLKSEFHLGLELGQRLWGFVFNLFFFVLNIFVYTYIKVQEKNMQILEWVCEWIWHTCASLDSLCIQTRDSVQSHRLLFVKTNIGSFLALPALQMPVWVCTNHTVIPNTIINSEELKANKKIRIKSTSNIINMRHTKTFVQRPHRLRSCNGVLLKNQVLVIVTYISQEKYIESPISTSKTWNSGQLKILERSLSMSLLIFS